MIHRGQAPTTSRGRASLERREVQMPTYYVEDYDGKREDEAERVVIPLPPDTEAKVVEAESAPAPAKKTSRAQTKG